MPLSSILIFLPSLISWNFDGNLWYICFFIYRDIGVIGMNLNNFYTITSIHIGICTSIMKLAPKIEFETVNIYGKIRFSISIFSVVRIAH